ncbi:hypothetical protein GOODEAATRI_022074 [Goodea atripinnis]|uniref:Uncharacterized protein n=1 Tax=Goodea atripinnis TaxID=208336 RepID=A0ABV0N5Q3_9TELE
MTPSICQVKQSPLMGPPSYFIADDVSVLGSVMFIFTLQVDFIGKLLSNDLSLVSNKTLFLQCNAMLAGPEADQKCQSGALQLTCSVRGGKVHTQVKREY